MECECTGRCMSIGNCFFFLHKCMSASVGNTINHALLRLHNIRAYHVTAVTVHRLDGIEARTMASNNDSTRR
jgi:hypothetical protein